jgi:hypothetical protein
MDLRQKAGFLCNLIARAIMPVLAEHPALVAEATNGALGARVAEQNAKASRGEADGRPRPSGASLVVLGRINGLPDAIVVDLLGRLGLRWLGWGSNWGWRRFRLLRRQHRRRGNGCLRNLRCWGRSHRCLGRSGNWLRRSHDGKRSGIRLRDFLGHPNRFHSYRRRLPPRPLVQQHKHNSCQAKRQKGVE